MYSKNYYITLILQMRALRIKKPFAKGHATNESRVKTIEPVCLTHFPIKLVCVILLITSENVTKNISYDT